MEHLQCDSETNTESSAELHVTDLVVNEVNDGMLHHL